MKWVILSIRLIFGVVFLWCLIYSFLLWRQGLLLHSGIVLAIGLGSFVVAGILLLILRKLSPKSRKYFVER